MRRIQIAVVFLTFAVAAVSVITSAAEAATRVTASKRTCRFYNFWQLNNGTVVCFGAGGNACAVCVN